RSGVDEATIRPLQARSQGGPAQDQGGDPGHWHRRNGRGSGSAPALLWIGLAPQLGGRRAPALGVLRHHRGRPGHHRGHLVGSGQEETWLHQPAARRVGPGPEGERAMDHESEVIHHQMEETRASLSEKLETLESKVVGTVKETTQAVAETVETVKETFNLRHQFDRHPWVMLGGSAAVGMSLGWLLSGQRRGRRPSLEAGIQHRWEGRPLEPQSFAAAPPSPNGSWLHRLASSFEPEL